MNNKDNQEQDFEWELKDIEKYSSTDPKGIVKGQTTSILTEKQAQELNYARALNGNPYRLIKVE